MRTLKGEKLGDECCDYVLTIACKHCGHVRAADPKALARLTDLKVSLVELAKRLRCSECGQKDVEPTPNVGPRITGHDFRG